MGSKLRRIETKTSRTAEFTCLSRAISYYEKEPHYRSNDEIATKIVPGFIKVLMHSRRLRDLFSKKFAPQGIYEYVIARTKFIDEIFQHAMAEGFDQILIFGAGFDSRGIRLMNGQSRTKVYELDVEITQNAKIKQLKKRGITVPPNLIFVPMDFNKEKIANKLQSHGFQDQKRNLYILEGVIMYLNPDSVDQTFKVISKGAGPGCEVVFDYVTPAILQEEDFFKSIQKAGEGWTFGIPDEGLQQFLDAHGFTISKVLNSAVLEQHFFTDQQGNRIGRVNDSHRLVLARKS